MVVIIEESRVGRTTLSDRLRVDGITEGNRVGLTTLWDMVGDGDASSFE